MSGNSNQTFRGKASADASGARYFPNGITPTTPGAVQVLYTEVIGANSNIRLLGFDGSCELEGVLRVTVNSTVVMSKITGPGSPNVDFAWLPFELVESGSTLEVEFEGMAGRPPTDVHWYLQGREIAV